MNPDEGYIKFNLNWKEISFDFKDQDFIYINSCREKLFKMNLIGAYPNGIGFGNLSIRYKKNEFIISGSATGNFKHLSKEHYSLVKDYAISKNSIHCEGLTKASSESLSHAAIYESNLNVAGIIHIHNKDMWNKYLYELPTTDTRAEFGTPEIAAEIQRLANHDSGMIIMGGHPEGIISYGKSLNNAKETILKYFKNL